MISCAIHKKSLGGWRHLLRQTSVPGVIGLFLFFTLLPHPSQAGELATLQKYIQNGGYALSKDGKVVVSKNLQKNFIPASTIKLITCLAALELLGPDYRFTTRLFLDKEGNLYISGSGDPFLVSEKVTAIARKVAEQGITEIRNIILDDSSFALENPTDGSGNSPNPYDAQPSALGVNFNTLPLHVVHKAKVRSFEAQTPYLPLMGKIGETLQSGRHRVNTNAFPDQGTLSNTLNYCGQLFQVTLEQHGIRMRGRIRQGEVPEESSLILHYVAQETVADLVRSCLRSSSNFMANQLYLAIGMSQYGIPATWEKSQRAVNDFIHNHLRLQADQVTMVEGSGLSRKNRISPEGLIQVLEKFKPHAPLLPTKYGVLLKSGTLNDADVYCYAGYFRRGENLNPFVILLNQKTNGRDRVLQTLFSL